MTVRDDYVKEVASKFVKHLENGDIPWSRKKQTQTNFNPVSGHEFAGMNQLVLEMEGMDKGYSDPRWMTYTQARKLGGFVRENESPTKLEYLTYTRNEPIMDHDGKEQVRDDNGKLSFVQKKLDRPEVFYVDVFNASQVEGLEAYKAPKKEKLPFDKAEEIIKEFGVKISEGRQPHYDKNRDMLTLPPKESYKSQEEYYASILYQLGHATGHKNRMVREDYAKGSKEHAKEELRNELSSYFTSKDTGIRYNPVRNTAHIKSWIEMAKERPREIFQAARDGMQIKKYLLEPESRERLHEKASMQAVHRKNKLERGGSTQNEPKISPAKEFASLLVQAGIEVDKIVPDGKWHNVKQTAYRVHLDGTPNGYVINKNADLAVKWFPQGREIDGADVKRLHAETQANKERYLEQQEETWQQAGKRSYAILMKKETAKIGDHPYLTTNPKDAIKYDKVKDSLYVPIQDRYGKPMSYQRIEKDGKEVYMKGGKVKEGMLRIGSREDFEKKPVVISTNLKDAMKIHKDTGSPTVLSFIPSNVENVANVMREQYKDKSLIISVGKNLEKKQKEQLAAIADKFNVQALAPSKIKSALQPKKDQEMEIA